MKYKELLEQLNKLNEEQLEQAVEVICTDSPCIQIEELWVSEEDCINPTEEGIEPISAYTNSDVTDDPMTENEVKAEFEVVVNKGDVFLVKVED